MTDQDLEQPDPSADHVLRLARRRAEQPPPAQGPADDARELDPSLRLAERRAAHDAVTTSPTPAAALPDPALRLARRRRDLTSPSSED